MLLKKATSCGLVLAFTSFAISACKPRRIDQASRVAAAGKDCSEVVTRAQDKALIQQIAGIQKNYFDGKISLTQQRGEIDRLVKSGGGPQSSAALSAAMAIEASAAAVVTPAAIEFDPDEDLSPALIHALRGAGVDPNLAYAYVAMVHERLKAPASALKAAGASYNPGTGWQLENVPLSVAGLKADAKLRTAIAYFFSPQVLAKLEDPDRLEAVFVGSEVLMPPAADGKIALTSREHWDSVTNTWLATYKREAATFIRATRQANTYGNLMKGRLIQIFGGERGHQGKTAPEIEAESAYNTLIKAITQLRAMGVGEALRRELVISQKILVDLEGESIKEGLAKLDRAQKAAIAAPFIPVAIWVAPYAGGLMGAQWAPIVANAATTAAAMPLAFSVGSVALSAGLHMAAGNTDYACDVYEQFVSRASGGLYAAAYAAWTPVLVSATAGGAAIAIPGAPAAATTYGIINLGLATKSLVGMVSSGVSGAKECLAHIERVRGLTEVNRSTVDAAAGEALEACVSAGIDLGFAVVETAHFTSEAYQALAKGEIAPLLHEQCELGLTAKVCGKKPKKTEEGGDNLSPEELMAHYGKKMPYDEKEHEALLAYGGEDYTKINKTLREGGTINGRTKIGKYIKEIDEAMAKAKSLPGGLVIYRGEQAKKNAREPKPGDVVEMDSYTSTSLNPLIADRFAIGYGTGGQKPGSVPTEYIISVPEGKNHPAVYMEQVPGIKYPGEQELLLPRDSRLKIKKVKTEKRNVYGMEFSVKQIFAELVN